MILKALEDLDHVIGRSTIDDVVGLGESLHPKEKSHRLGSIRFFHEKETAEKSGDLLSFTFIVDR